MSGGRRAARLLREHRWALLGGGLVWLVMSARVLLLAGGSTDRFIGAVPDDAFYYFQLARNFVEHRSWTFDGVAPTTGFHPLYAYLLVGLHAVAGDLDARGLLLVVGLTSALALGTAAALVGATATRLLGRTTVPLVVAVFVTPMALLQTTFLMETWLVCLAAATTVLLVTTPRRPTRSHVVWLLLLGVLGELARTDYLVLVVALVLGHLVARRPAGHDGLRRSLLVLVGGLVALALDTALNLATSGSLLQASVRVKWHWADVMFGPSQPPAGVLDALHVPTWLVTATFTPFLPAQTMIGPSNPLVAALWLGAGLGVVLLVRIRVRSGDLPAATLPLCVSCVGAVLGYLLVYSRDAAVQLWYAGNLLVPSALVLACLGRAVFGSRLLVPAVSVAALSLAFVPLVITATPYPSQTALYKAAVALRVARLDGSVGAWNAGILGFVSERGVVNLDGLVNDDAVPFILDNRLDDYVRERGIRYVADHDVMITEPLNRRRGGYDGTRLVGCLQQSEPLDRWPADDVDGSVALWQIRPGCLGAGA